ncbi:MAG: PDZ domain-containing protein [Candidatus Neomarinimicrobiota bacterium]|nr:PDZ domain-containing protein [Candidatus Neomarinimicrobiota bacterium]
MKKLAVGLSLLLLGATVDAESQINYHLSMPEPHTHYYHVEMAVSGNTDEKVAVKMPVWTPGSYLVREFARHIPRVRAYAGLKELKVEKVNKNTWEVTAGRHAEFTLKYRVYAYEQTVRTSFLNDSRGYLNGTSIFLYVEGRQNEPGEVKVTPFRGWKQISTGLPTMKGRRNTYSYENYDILADSPFLIGNHNVLTFKLKKKPHEIALFGEGNVDKKRMKDDFKKIVETTMEIFGKVPYDRYVFHILLLDGLGGGLEHLNSTTIQADRWIFSDDDRYHRFLSTVAHEYFHTWNVKRIRPIALGPFDYERENYTTDLWISEGITSYYDNLLLLRSGILEVKEYFKFLGRDISSVEKAPGRQVQSVVESSFDTWIKYYRRNEESPNVLISYYSKGAIVGLLLHLAINATTDGEKSLDDVFRELNRRYETDPSTGFTSKEFREISETVAGRKLDDVWRYADTTDEIDYNTLLETVGCELERKYGEGFTDSTAYFGFETKSKGNPIVTAVRAGTPAYAGGLNVNDEIVSVNGTRVSTNTLTKRLEDVPQGGTAELLISREGLIQTVTLTSSGPPHDGFNVKKLEKTSDNQKRLFEKWLGTPWEE